MTHPVRRLAAAALLLASGLAAVFLVGMRRKSPLVQGQVKRLARTVGNPRALRTAGLAGSSTGVVHHVGRTSGRPYRTPVTPYRAPGGFVVALPYGPGADWVRNVLAAGEATLTFDGRDHPVTDPRVVPVAEVADLLPPSERAVLKVFNVTEILRLDDA